MQLFVKYIAQFLLLPLAKDLVGKLIQAVRQWWLERQARKELEREARETQTRVENYETSDPDRAFDEFRRLSGNPESKSQEN